MSSNNKLQSGKNVLSYGGLALTLALLVGSCYKCTQAAKELVEAFKQKPSTETSIVPAGENGNISIAPEVLEKALGSIVGKVSLEVQTTVKSDAKIFGDLFNVSWDDAQDNIKVGLEAEYGRENRDFYGTAHEITFETIDGVEYAMIKFSNVPQPKLQEGSIRKSGAIQKTGEQDTRASKSDLDRLNAAERQVELEKVKLFTRNIDAQFDTDPTQCEKFFEAILTGELGKGVQWFRLFENLKTPDGVLLFNNPAMKGKKLGIQFETEYQGNKVTFLQLEGKGPGKAKVQRPWKKINQILG